MTWVRPFAFTVETTVPKDIDTVDDFTIPPPSALPSSSPAVTFGTKG
jgi:hypothetical protein